MRNCFRSYADVEEYYEDPSDHLPNNLGLSNAEVVSDHDDEQVRIDLKEFLRWNRNSTFLETSNHCNWSNSTRACVRWSKWKQSTFTTITSWTLVEKMFALLSKWIFSSLDHHFNRSSVPSSVSHRSGSNLGRHSPSSIASGGTASGGDARHPNNNYNRETQRAILNALTKLQRDVNNILERLNRLETSTHFLQQVCSD